jgi:hypothetical protein
MAMHVVRTGNTRNAYILVKRSEKRRPLGRSRRRSGDKIKKDLKEIRCGLDSAHS